MSHHVITRSTGLALVVYGVGSAAAFLFSGAPGGSFDQAAVDSYTTTSHSLVAWALWYVGALSALALLVVGHGLRHLPGAGPALSRLCVVGAAVGVVGAFVTGGVDIAMVEGGDPVRTGVPGPVVYTLTEIGNLLAVCAPALCVGIAAFLLAARLPMGLPLRVFSVVAGLCGVLAPLFFTYFVFVLWTVVAGVALARRGQVDSTPAEPAPSLV